MRVVREDRGKEEVLVYWNESYVKEMLEAQGLEVVGVQEKTREGYEMTRYYTVFTATKSK